MHTQKKQSRERNENKKKFRKLQSMSFDENFHFAIKKSFRNNFIKLKNPPSTSFDLAIYRFIHFFTKSFFFQKEIIKKESM